jgi:molybdopterin-guanine dinucleotide biosynthesis protein A
VATARLTGVLLVGGASTRFGSPKAQALFEGETLAERGWRTLGEVCDERIAVGKQADGLALPFDVLDDASDVRAPLAGVVAGLRAATHDRCVVLPVDTPLVRPEHLRALAATDGIVTVPQTGPLPGVYSRSALPELEQRLHAGKLALRGALGALDTRVLTLDCFALANVNTARDLPLIATRARAVRAAELAARAHGVEVNAPTVLQDWNDTIVHLRPAPVVARVRTSWLDEDPEATVERELAIVGHAAARGAPVVRPTPNARPGPHRFEGLTLSFWEYVEELPAEVTPSEAAASLRSLHAALADYPSSLPTLWSRLERAQSAVADARSCPRLPEDDRRFLAARVEALSSAFRAMKLPERPIHGGPHLANLLQTPIGPRWIDFDTVCLGPLEWDLAHLPEAAAASYPDASREALSLARELVSAEVAVWCWCTYGRAPEVDEAARFHLARSRAAN